MSDCERSPLTFGEPPVTFDWCTRHDKPLAACLLGQIVEVHDDEQITWWETNHRITELVKEARAILPGATKTDP